MTPTPQPMQLGTCYYPEHWPEAKWAEDAARMAAMGLSRVRIAEFAWSRIEPEAGRFDWDWLDRAVEVLHGAGLGVIMCTPTATPPKWLVDAMPDMVAVDRSGRVRGFGSRRHYCFSHAGYRAESRRITRAVAERYGAHPGVVMWQTDNEFGCHATTVSYSDAARAGFRRWLAQRYANVAALNAAWGNVFWSMDYASFDAIELPNLTVTEANPAHWLDFRRYASDQVVAFNREQVEIIRECSPGRAVAHNFMGFVTDFDHHAMGADIDVAGWDSYPLGFLESFWFSEPEKAAYQRQGHPDIAAFHHDLYRGCTVGGRWAVLEQQPGPVNWARWNPAPLPGMVRLWTLEAAAHGAELVSYFRWRQAPFAQEQMHAGLLRPDSIEAPAADEVRSAAADLAAIGAIPAGDRHVALIWSYDADWVTDIQPQGAGFKAVRQAFEMYSAFRQCGLNVDIVAPGAAWEEYPLVVIPCLPILPDGFAERLAAHDGEVLIGPRTGSKTANLTIPDGLAPGDLVDVLGVKVTRVESLRPGSAIVGDPYAAIRWFEEVEADYPPVWRLADERGILWRNGRCSYLSAWLDEAGLRNIAMLAAKRAGLPMLLLPDGVRSRRAGDLLFVFNYAAEARNLDLAGEAVAVVGGAVLDPAALAVWRVS
jgi:beta-galactosidase